MIDLDTLLSIDPYSLDKKEKGEILTRILKQLTQMHFDACEPYQKMMKAMNLHLESISHYDQLPFLPVSLFKEFDLKSIPDGLVFKTLTSSGTSGQAVSKIYLDKESASIQQKVLVKIVSSFTKSSRLPMLIIDSPSVIKDRTMFSARGAGILGFSIFGADRTYALDESMQLDVEAVKSFLERHQNQRILIFGFTFMVWQYFCKELEKSNIKIDLSKAILIHGGGWKKLISEAVSSQIFQETLTDVCGLSDIHDYYGMVEQTGCIYMQCEEGYLHASNFSDIIFRKAYDFSVCEIGEKGIIQVVSVLPKSYPGHSLLTEDEGALLGEDDCPCGRKGKHFKIFGRIKNAEIRGCSDTHTNKRVD